MLGLTPRSSEIHSKAHQNALIERIQSGDMRALNQLIRENKRLVDSQLSHWRYRCQQYTGVSIEMLASAGMNALSIAAQKFDLTKGTKFSTYAVEAIRSEMRAEFCRATGVTRTHLERVRDAREVAKELAVTLGRTPTKLEIAAAMAIKPNLLEKSLGEHHKHTAYSLNCSIGEGDMAYIDTIAAVDQPTGLEGVTDSLHHLHQQGYLSSLQVDLLTRIYQGYSRGEMTTEYGLSDGDYGQLINHAKQVLAAYDSGQLSLDDYTPQPTPTIRSGGVWKLKQSILTLQNALSGSSVSRLARRLSASTEAVSAEPPELSQVPQGFLRRFASQVSQLRFSRPVRRSPKSKPRIPVDSGKFAMRRSAILAALFGLGVVAAPSVGHAAPIPIDKAIEDTIKIKLSDAGELLDFSKTKYRVAGAIPSDPGIIRAVKISEKNDQQIVLRWVPGSKGDASVLVKLQSASGKNTVLAIQADRGKDNRIKTSFSPSQQIQPGQPIVQMPEDTLLRPRRDKPPSIDVLQPKAIPKPRRSVKVRVRPTSQPPSPVATLTHPKSPPNIKLRASPKPVHKVAKVSARGRTLIDRTTLDNHALAHYLLRGLHRARGLRQINRHHDNYWFAQSMARYLQRGVAVEKALRWSGLPEKTYNDLLGHGGVARE